MRGKAVSFAFPRVFLAATGYFRKTYETLDSEMGGGGRIYRTLSRRGASRLRSWPRHKRIIYGREIGTCVS